MTIHIESLTFDAIIGILEEERKHTQRVIIHASITYDPKKFIDYAEVIELIEKTVITEKFELIETAVNTIAQRLLSTYQNIETLTLKITKPDIFSHCQVSASATFTTKT